MEIVLDTNILLRTLISQGNILDLFFDDRLIVYAPKKLGEEFIKNQEEIMKKSCLSFEEFNDLKKELFSRVIFIEEKEYLSYLPRARKLLKSNEKDEDFIALCLLKNIKLWTYEDLIFKIGLGVSTKEIKENLEKE